MRTFPKCNPSNLPADLRANAFFCLWRYEKRANNDKPTKPPYNPRTGEYANPRDPATFSDFETASTARGQFDGMGILIHGELSAVDIDHCINEDGQLSDLAADVMRTMNTYTERSPSGEGLRLLFRTPGGVNVDKARYYVKRSEIGLEIYTSGNDTRFVTVTGDTLNGAQIEDRSAEILQVIHKYMERPNIDAPLSFPSSVGLSFSDDALLQRAKAARNGETFARLWGGDISSYPSHSEADQALCNQLAFWTGGNLARMDALFRQSGLMREKWIKREDYRKQTLEKAVAGCKEFYNPTPKDVPQRPQGGAAAAQAAPITVGASSVEVSSTEVGKSTGEAVKRSAVDVFDCFLDKVQTEAYKPIKTGMPDIDSLLGGGFYPQSLVYLGGSPGIGKTTFAQSLFEAQAAAGRDVIFINLEMSAEQLLAKSISRMIRREQGEKGVNLTATEIMRGYKWTEPQRRAVIKAAVQYRQRIAPHLQYNPDGTTSNVQSIVNTLRAALDAVQTTGGGSAPAIVLDYLQLVQGDGKTEPQEAIKQVIAAMKEYAINGNTVACAILAFNRDSNKNGRVTLESGRDTSSIEYSGDIMLGLNYAALEDGTAYTQELDKLQKESPRHLTIKVLKNRMGESGGRMDFNFDGASGTFTRAVSWTLYER